MKADFQLVKYNYNKVELNFNDSQTDLNLEFTVSGNFDPEASNFDL